jgi:hypothetical protein
MLRVCALADQIDGPCHDHLLALERSLYAKGVPFFFTMESLAWNWNRKIQWELETVEAHPDDTFVFIDALDFLFVGERDELERVVSSCPLLFACDCGSAPFPNPDLAEWYAKRRPKLTDWCWLNGCGPAGNGKAIAEAIHFGMEHFPPVKRLDTDQLFWSKVYLSGYGVLDQFCLLTQALYDMDQTDNCWITPHLGHKDGRVVNLLTGSKPQFLHASGQSWNAIPAELIPPPGKRLVVR